MHRFLTHAIFVLACLVPVAILGNPNSFAAEFIGAMQAPPPPKASPLTAEEQLATFTVPPEFEVELVAADPDVSKVVTVAFDSAGRMWAITAVEYPIDENEAPERARELYAGNGRDKVLVFDTPTASGRQKPRVFAEGLAIPLGVLPWRNGVIVGHGRDIVLLTDTNGDGKADKREVLLTGFGIQDSHLFPHQFTRGAGNWIYLAQGAFNYSKARDRDGREVQFDQTKMARFHPDGTAFEIVCWGLNNIWGFVTSRAGEMWIQEANDLGYPVVPFHIGANYPGIGMHKAKPYAPWQPPLANHFQMGGTGLSGLALAQDLDGFPAPYAGIFYVANPITGKIQAIRAHPDGSSYRLEKLADFVQCGDPWFRPVAIHFGPDSALYIVDWYNKIISHNEVPRDHPERDKVSGRIWRVRHKSMARRTPPDLTRVAEAKLISHLAAANTWEANAAWHEIIDRNAQTLAPQLRELTLRDAMATDARIRALWALEGLGAADVTTLAKLLPARDRNLRREAVRVFATQRVAADAVVRSLEPLIDDPDAQVRAEVIRTLGSLPAADARAIELLVRMAKAPLDSPTVNPQQGGGPVHVGAAADRDFERYLARAALETRPDDVLRFLDSPIASKIPEENRIVALLAAGSPAAAGKLARMVPQLDRAPTSDELVLLAANLQEPGVSDALKKLVSDDRAQPQVFRALLDARNRVDAANAAALLGTPLKTLLATNRERDRVLQALALVRAFRISQIEPEVAAFAEAAASVEDRRAAVSTLREIGSSRVELFHRFAHAAIPGDALQRDAVQALASVKSEQAVALLVDVWPNLPPALRRLAVDALAGSRSAGEALLKAVRTGDIKADEIDTYTFDKLRAVLGDNAELTAVLKEISAHAHPVLRLDGSDSDYVDTSITLSGPFTVETWIKLDPGIENTDGILAGIGSADINFAGGRFRVYANQPEGDVIIAKKQIGPDVWTHVAATRDSAGRYKLYINGELDTAESKVCARTFEKLRIGYTLAGGGTAGWLAEFRVWNVERTANEIRENANRSFIGEARPGSLTHLFAGDDWTPLKGKARVERIVDVAPIFTAEQARDVAAKFVHFRDLAQRPGDPTRGKATFQTACQTCHSVHGEGGQIGPTLNGAGALGIEALLRSVLTPNAAMESGYRKFRVETRDGEVQEGFLVAQDDQAVVLRQPNAEDLRIPRTNIKRAAFTRFSMMPEGLLEGLKEQDAADLLAYLSTLR